MLKALCLQALDTCRINKAESRKKSRGNSIAESMIGSAPSLVGFDSYWVTRGHVAMVEFGPSDINLDAVLMVDENESEDEFFGELPNYVDQADLEQRLSDCNRETVEVSQSDGFGEKSGGIVDALTGSKIPKRKMKRIDPRISWEFSKAFGCTSNISDEAMVEWNRHLDSELEKEFNVEFF